MDRGLILGGGLGILCPFDSPYTSQPSNNMITVIHSRAMTPARDMQTPNEDSNYGIDWEGPTPASQEADLVEVPETFLPAGCSLEDIQHINPLADSDEHGIDLYLNVLNTLLQND